MTSSSFLRLGGMITAYKIVPDEIDEIKVIILCLFRCIPVFFQSIVYVFEILKTCKAPK